MKSTHNFKTLFIQGVSLIVITGLLQIFLPWWIIAVSAFILAYVFNSSLLSSFVISFTALFILWSVAALWANQNFDTSMAQLIGHILGPIKPFYVFIITGIVGGFVAGLGGLMGSWTRYLAQK